MLNSVLRSRIIFMRLRLRLRVKFLMRLRLRLLPYQIAGQLLKKAKKLTLGWDFFLIVFYD
jgi:hypothetical protein